MDVEVSGKVEISWNSNEKEKKDKEEHWMHLSDMKVTDAIEIICQNIEI